MLEVGHLVGSVLPFGQIRNGKHQPKDSQHPQDKMTKLLTRTFLGNETRKIILTWVSATESGHWSNYDNLRRKSLTLNFIFQQGDLEASAFQQFLP